MYLEDQDCLQILQPVYFQVTICIRIRTVSKFLPSISGYSMYLEGSGLSANFTVRLFSGYYMYLEESGLSPNFNVDFQVTICI